MWDKWTKMWGTMFEPTGRLFGKAEESGIEGAEQLCDVLSEMVADPEGLNRLSRGVQELVSEWVREQESAVSHGIVPSDESGWSGRINDV